MWPFLGSLVTGGASLLGGMFSSDTSAQNTQAQIQASQQQQATQNQFSERMSSTAYQRASQDMQSAGLNPMMMFGSGSAASSPTGSGIQAPMPQNTHPFAGLGDAATKAISSAVSVKTMDKMADEMANLEAENARIKETAKNIAAQTETEKKRPEYLRRQTQSVAQDVTEKKLDRARQEWEAIKHLDLSSIPDGARKAGNIGAWGGQKLGDTISPVLSTARGIHSMLPKRSTRERSDIHGSQSFDEMWSNRIR